MGALGPTLPSGTVAVAGDRVAALPWATLAGPRAVAAKGALGAELGAAGPGESLGAVAGARDVVAGLAVVAAAGLGAALPVVALDAPCTRMLLRRVGNQSIAKVNRRGLYTSDINRIRVSMTSSDDIVFNQ